MANEIEIPLKLSGVQSLKAELRSLKAAIAEASDPEQMAALAARAGEVADRIKDANDAVNVFASGSKFEQISNSFGGIRDSLMSLDFEEASEKAKVFSKSLGGLNAQDISKSMKGLTSTVTTMGGAFVKLGAQILTNPIFLLAAVITAIVVAIGVWLNKIGVLQKAIDFLMTPINLLIDAFKELTDWLGLTSYAAEENARTMEKANEKAFKSSEKRTAAISDQYDIEIAKAKAAGKDTTKLELDKSKSISDAAKKRLADARSEYAELKGLSDKDSIERRKALRKRIEEENKLIKDGSKERQLIEIADQAEAKAAADKAAEEAKAKREAAAKAYKEGRAAIQKEITAANKLLTDSTKTQTQVEIDDTKAKYAALIAEAKKYNLDITALEKAQSLEINKIRKEDSEAVQTLSTNTARSIVSTMVDTRTKTLQIQGEGNMESFEQKKKADADALAQEEAVRDAKFAIANSAVQGLSALGELFINDQKKLEKFNKAQALIQIGVDTAKAISSLVAMSNANPFNSVTAGAAGIAQYAAGIVQIVTNIAKAKSILMNPTNTSAASSGGGGGTSSNASGGGSSVPSFVPGNLFGQGNASNNVGAPTGMESSQNITVTAVVSETEITATQNKVNKIMKNSVL